MAYKSSQVSASGTTTEIEQMQIIIDAITGLDSRITCNTTAAAQFADLTSASKAEFEFTVNDKFSFKMTRKYTNDTRSTNYIFTTIINNVVYSSKEIQFWRNLILPTGSVSADASFKIAMFDTENEIIIWIGANPTGVVSDQYPKKYCLGLIKTSDNKYLASGVADTNDIMSQSFYDCDSVAGGFSLVNMIPYGVDVGQIHLLSGNYNPISLGGVIDSYSLDLIPCSTVTLFASLTIGGRSYFAIGTNLLVEVIEEAAA